MGVQTAHRSMGCGLLTGLVLVALSGVTLAEQQPILAVDSYQTPMVPPDLTKRAPRSGTVKLASTIEIRLPEMDPVELRQAKAPRTERSGGQRIGLERNVFEETGVKSVPRMSWVAVQGGLVTQIAATSPGAEALRVALVLPSPTQRSDFSGAMTI